MSSLQTNQGLDSDELLTTVEAAKLLNISEALFASKKSNDPQFPAAVGKKPGSKGMLLYRRSDLLTWQKGKHVKGLDANLVKVFLTAKSRCMTVEG
jgi:hypothetical protein